MVAIVVGVAALALGVAWGFTARRLRVPAGPWAGRVADALAVGVVALMMSFLNDYRAPAVIAYMAGFAVGRFAWPPVPALRDATRGDRRE